jgi:hypothetical protein
MLYLDEEGVEVELSADDEDRELVDTAYQRIRHLMGFW